MDAQLLDIKDLAVLLSMGRRSAREFCRRHGVLPVNVGLGTKSRLRWHRDAVMHLRHAFATDAIANGADMGTVAKLMGHANIDMVFKHYQHVATAQKRQAVESLPELDVSAVSCAMNHVPGNLTRVLQ